MLYTGVILAALGIIGRNLCARARKKNPTVIMFAVVACCFPLILVRWFHPLELFASEKSSRALAQTILDSPQKNLPIYGYYYFRTGLPFYLRRPVGLISSTADELTSNYIVTQWPGIQQEARTGQLPQSLAPAATDGMPLVMEEDALLAKRRSTPVLVLVRNNQVTQLANAVRTMESPVDRMAIFRLGNTRRHGSDPPSGEGRLNAGVVSARQCGARKVIILCVEFAVFIT